MLAAGLARGGDGVDRGFHRELGGSRVFILGLDLFLRGGEFGVEPLELSLGLVGSRALGVGVEAEGVGFAARLRDPRGGAHLPALDLSLEHARGVALLDARGGRDVVMRARAGLADARGRGLRDAGGAPGDLVLGVGGHAARLHSLARRRGRPGRAVALHGRGRGPGDFIVGAVARRDAVMARDGVSLARRGDARVRVDASVRAAGGAAGVLGPRLHGVSVGDRERGRRGREQQQHRPGPRPSGHAGATHRAPRTHGGDRREAADASVDVFGRCASNGRGSVGPSSLDARRRVEVAGVDWSETSM